jgi:chloramphenicol O-acetyltransferase type B
MKAYLDRSLFRNPVGVYFSWLKLKCSLQLKYWGKHLRIGYLSLIHNCVFGSYNWVGEHCVIINSELGDFSYVNSYTYIMYTKIGKYCSVGPNVKIAPGKHPTSVFVSTHPVTFNNQGNFVRNFVDRPVYQNYQQVTIGNDVWIGANAIIIDGVKIADGAIIAANSMVVKDVGLYEIVGGNPAKFIKKRFDDDQIDYLLYFKWWNKNPEWIEQNISRFWDIESFVEYEYSN